MIGPEHEQAQGSTGDGFADAVTFSFADVDRGWFGLARLGLATATGASALVVLFRGREPVAATARGGLEAHGSGWELIEAGGVSTSVEEPLERWTVSGSADGHAFDLRFTAISAPAEIGDAVAQAGGMAGYEQLCTVAGTVRASDEIVAIDGLGQRGHSWGAPDWSRLELARTVSAWLGPERGGIALTTVRPEDASGHDAEAVWATLIERGEPVHVADPRLSTTYDAEGRQRRAGLELWIGEEDSYPYRAAGEVLCGSTLDLGQLRMDLAFVRWHAEGHEGIGRYDVVRRA